MKEKKIKTFTKRSLFFGIILLVIGTVVLYLLSSQYLQKLPIPEISVDRIKFMFCLDMQDSVEHLQTETICVSSNLSDMLIGEVSEWSDINGFSCEVMSETNGNCDYIVSDRDEGDMDLAWKKYYVPIVAVESSVDNISVEDIENLLGGGNIFLGTNEYSLSLSSDAYDFLDRAYGVGVSLVASENFSLSVSESNNTIGIIAFDELVPAVKSISVDNILLVEGSEDDYNLVDKVWVKERSQMGLFYEVQSILEPVNFEKEKLVSVVVTGTSVVGARGLYKKIVETNDNLYPIHGVADVLRSADIAHISNESSFVHDCIQNSWTMQFCGTTDSFTALEYAGVDVVGLTGDHILDYGVDNFMTTLDMYDTAEIKYFGGGRNFADAHTPAIIEVQGTKFAFLGYNQIPPNSYFATDTSPGSAQLEMTQMQSDIISAKQNADFVLVDMQWGDEYERGPNSYQVEFGHAAINAGADIVTGVHPHWVQQMEYYGNGVIFYGLGNLMFDQMWSEETREGIIVKHLFYGNQYIGFKIIPTKIYEGAQPRLVIDDSKTRITNYLFGPE